MFRRQIVSARRAGPSLRRRRYLSTTAINALRNSVVDIHPEVRDALAALRPVVALETTLITHGLPYPTNLETGQKLESIVRAHGSVPATIGIIDGRVKVGLNDNELQRLADTTRNKSVKVSRRDIGPTLALKKDGGTTICSTLIFAHLAGIKVVATGGLGGVHRGVEHTMDISADLQELARNPVGLVTCGVKSILDIARTLEYLETMGVPVITYGKDYNFPAFFCGRSEFETNWKVDDPRTAAKILDLQRRLGLQNATFFAAPMPDEYAESGSEVQRAVDQAIRESEDNGISKRGKEVTPWLLSRVAELTHGKSMGNNLVLLENTAAIGSKIAVEYAKLQEESRDELVTANATLRKNYSEPGVSAQVAEKKTVDDAQLLPSPELLVIGASAIDITGRVLPNKNGVVPQYANTTVPGMISLTVGGVARNIAEAAHRLLSSGTGDDKSATLLVSPIGDDEFAPFLIDEQARLGMRTDGFIRLQTSRTAVCDMLLDTNGGLLGGVADMAINHELSDNVITQRLQEERPSLVALDGNLSPELLSAVLSECWSRKEPVPVLFEPTSVTKATSILHAIEHQIKTGNPLSPVAYATPNILELSALCRESTSGEHEVIDDHISWNLLNKFGLGSEWRMDIEQLAKLPACPSSDKGDLSFILNEGVAQMALHLLPLFQNLIIKCGDKGVIVLMRISNANESNTSWFNERSNIYKRYIVGKGIAEGEYVVLRHFPAIPISKEEIVSVTGAGDSLVGALCAAITRDPNIFRNKEKLEAAIQLSQKAAILSLHSIRSVSPSLKDLGVSRTST